MSIRPYSKSVTSSLISQSAYILKVVLTIIYKMTEVLVSLCATFRSTWTTHAH